MLFIPGKKPAWGSFYNSKRISDVLSKQDGAGIGQALEVVLSLADIHFLINVKGSRRPIRMLDLCRMMQ